MGAVGGAAGFDLDMTLVDTRPGIRLALLALAGETGRAIDAEAIVSALGPPVAEALSPWFTEAELPQAVQAFRRHMAEVGVMNVGLLPGAAVAVDAARDAGLAVVVITSKIEPLAWATLRHTGLHVDRVFGNVWAEGKAEPLMASAAVCYTGDHPADMVAATKAKVPGYGVTTGASSREQLLEAGATDVATDLSRFPAWLKAIVVG